ncbi:hypothetical protein HDU97_006848 [Phlyctochytrium planicorne]|nr:hypothetical protein HDU97_006848 [Phlyctochytrium planicorne]
MSSTSLIENPLPPSTSTPLNHLFPIHHLSISNPSKVISYLISLIASGKDKEGKQLSLLGTLLVLANRTASQPNHVVDAMFPNALLVLEDAKEFPMGAQDVDGLTGLDVKGVVLMQKPKVEFWFKDGPGAQADAQGLFVRKVVEEAFGNLKYSNKAQEDDAEEDDDGEVFLYCVDVRYMDAILGVARREWMEHGYGVYEMPMGLVFEKEWVKQVGEVWKGVDGEEYVMDVVNGDDYDQIMEYSTVQYPKPYIHMLITQQPFTSLSRVIRLRSSPQKKGSMVSWIISHINLSLGLLSTVHSHRRKGLANLCVASLCEAQIEFVRTQAQRVGVEKEVEGVVRPYAFIAGGNEASQKLFGRIGFVKLDVADRSWCGVRID